MSAPAFLQAQQVSIQFGGLRALTEFNLTVQQGDLKGLIGPNGAGKTTAFNVLTGVYAPTQGDVTIDGRRANGERPFRINRSGVARTFQNIRLFKELSALDNVRVAIAVTAGVPFSTESIRRVREWRPRPALQKLWTGVWWVATAQMLFAFSKSKARVRPLESVLSSAMEAVDNYVDWWRAFLKTPSFVRAEAKLTQDADELLNALGLSHRRDEIARNLPYGEQRRLEIARALATRPTVLLLDEPAAGMNTKEKADLMTLIRELRDRFSLGVLVIEHDMKLVMGICEHITVLDHGETIATGTPAEVRANPQVIAAYLGEAPAHG